MDAKPGVVSIARATQVLECLGEGCERINEISLQTGLSKSTTHRLLKSLVAARLVIQDKSTHRYYLGPLLIQLSAKPFTAHSALLTFAVPLMRKLWVKIDETVSLHIRIGVERLCLEEIPSSQVIKHSSGKGDIAPIYAAAAGKVLLSKLSEPELSMLLNSLEMAPIAPNTITDCDELIRQIEATRMRGYATSTGERIANSACVSVPIENYVCPVALTVFGPEFRFAPREDYILSETLQTAKEISTRLGANFQV
jgi:DNA-binding IclR family transcriptional regulator